MLIKRTKHGQIGKAMPLVSNLKDKYTPIAVGSHTEGLASVLREVVPNVCLFKGLDFPSSPADETCLPTTLFYINRYTMKHIVDEYKSGNNLDLDVEKFLDSILKP
ncbi:uncharacterized protein LOC110442548 [Mizuhopecten yessoensis]|uniref:uncharacterized protein LOC110442548 n=1 Tax=Mizuhopecten yessoensis TaxID=6573 RepID=UPI000B45E97F|nr:uncharacterized protein LOC110442548 [Mizuhopecten yessoensis]